MTFHTDNTATVNGHLTFLTPEGHHKPLSAYTLEVIDTRARRGLRRWFTFTSHEVILTNPVGFSSAEELEGDIRDLVAIASLDNTVITGRIDATPNGCESFTYTVSRNEIDVTHQVCI